MNILVIGAGKVGIRLIQTLEHLGHDVAVVEYNMALLERVSQMDPPFTGNVVRGVPIDTDVLRSAGAEICDAVAAVTQDDNVNIMVGQMAKEVFRIKNIIVRIADPELKNVYSQRFGMHTVCGTNLTAQAFVTGLLYSAENADDDSSSRLTIGSNTVEFTTILAKEDQFGVLLSEAAKPIQGMIVFGILRASGAFELYSPESKLIVRAGDSIVYSQLAD